MNKKSILLGAIVITASALSFYSGSQYAARNSTTTKANADAASTFRQGGMRQRGANAASEGMLSGTVLSKNDQSIVIQTRDGSSKIVFISPSTEISKFVVGTSLDLEIGKSVSIFGDANPDGSESAKAIQLRPDNVPRPNFSGQATTTN
jgi:hypothetical protein